MDEENKKEYEPKLSTVIVIGGFFLYIILDLISLIPIAGDITDIPAAIIAFFVMRSGIGGTAIAIDMLISLIGKAIPGVQEIPLYTIAWIIVVWIDRHPSKATKLLEEVGEVAAVARGKAGGAAGAESALAEEEALASAEAEATTVAEETAEATSEAGGAASAVTEAEGETSEEIRRQAKKRFKEGLGTQDERGVESEKEGEGGDEDEEEEEKSTEDQQLEDEISGNHIARMAREYGAEGLFEQIGKPVDAAQAAIQKKTAQPLNNNRYNNREVDLRKNSAGTSDQQLQ